ncbi:class I SAM-dependent methyltransferase [Leptospirillum ferriphilum]|uniref:class I SAM-dependent methyltransferase n=1 Tax=Leptospirillum ferriphilum TaxID=178606 RepID=UPI000984214E|nr:class I SAM-dependent methyltransferase [Leptospirillum ferriphilum]OOH84243.1 SAM-dependent methyltransferase [Leptospirillum ferriphilum]
MGHVFNPRMVERLEDPARLEFQNPEKLLSLMKPLDGKGFLDFGVGTGFFAFPVYDRYGDKGPFFGVDIQPEMLALLKERSLGRYKREVLKTISASSFPLPLESESIGLMWMVNVYHEIDDRKKTLEELRRLLPPGGSLFLVDWKREETPSGPPMEERVAEVDLYDDLLEAGFDRIRSWDIYPWHMTVQVEK